MADGDKQQPQQPLQQMKSLWGQISPTRRLVTLGLLLGTLGLLGLLVMQARQANYRVLFNNLDETDSTVIAEELRQRGVDFQMSTDGTVIKVPAARRAELRVELVSHLNGNDVGFELFDQSTLGWTDFMQRVNHVRALQGMLTASVRELEAIQWAKVHISLPEEEVFVSQRSEPSASVLVRTHPGQRLSDRQVMGIIQLVARAVPDMEQEMVSVIDAERGVSLTPQAEDADAARGTHQEQIRQTYEEQRAQRIVAQLEPLVGQGKVVATVAATFDFTHQDVRQEELDRPVELSRTEKIEESGNTTANPSGVPGSDTQLGEQSVTAQVAGGARTLRETETRSESARTVTTSTKPGGRLVRQTASVTVAQRMIEKPVEGASGDDSSTPQVTLEPSPWTAEEIAHFEQLVKSAIEFSEQRQDQVAVVSLPFAETGYSADENVVYETIAKRQWITGLVRLGLFALAGVVLFLFVIRPVTREVIRPALLPQAAGAAGLLGHSVADLEAMGRASLPGGSEATEGGETRQLPDREVKESDDSLKSMTKANPAEAAQIIRTWLNEAR
jgi:flagellar M-ring protein FliF